MLGMPLARNVAFLAILILLGINKVRITFNRFEIPRSLQRGDTSFGVCDAKNSLLYKVIVYTGTTGDQSAVDFPIPLYLIPYFKVYHTRN